jgi:hypothetical protein
MGAKPFDLIETISGLLGRIDEGRKIVRETQHINDNFQIALANREKACRRIDELQRKMVPPDEIAQSQAKAELDRQVSEHLRLYDESSDLWRQLTETTTFLGPFRNDLFLLVERLPLKPEWDGYRQAVRSLEVGYRGCWSDPPDNSALDTLEMRLQEMLDLAIRTTRGKVRRFDPFPTPEGASWKDVSITFTSEHRVQIAVLSVTQTRGYAEMGFEDQRGGGGKPVSAWACLKLLAESAGMIGRPVDFNRLGWPKIEKNVQAIRARLRALFSIPGDPLPFRKGSYYEAQFRIKLGNSIEH